MAAHGMYAADGSWRITIVDGTSVVGRFAADGSLNVVKAPSPVTAPVGLYNGSGALYVTQNNNTEVIGFYAPDGSMYVTDLGANNAAIRVTVVSGSFGGGGGGGYVPTYYILGF